MDAGADIASLLSKHYLGRSNLSVSSGGGKSLIVWERGPCWYGLLCHHAAAGASV